jgi:hypothetical protein
LGEWNAWLPLPWWLFSSTPNLYYRHENT